MRSHSSSREVSRSQERVMVTLSGGYNSNITRRSSTILRTSNFRFQCMEVVKFTLVFAKHSLAASHPCFRHPLNLSILTRVTLNF